MEKKLQFYMYYEHYIKVHMRMITTNFITIGFLLINLKVGNHIRKLAKLDDEGEVQFVYHEYWMTELNWVD